MILPYTTKPSHVANKVVLNMIKRGSMPAGQRRFMLSDSAVVEDTDESVIISKEWQQIAGTNVTFSDYVDCDSSLFAFHQSSLKEILEQHQADANQEDNDDDDKEQEALPIPTLTAALEAMDTVRRYVCSLTSMRTLLISCRE
ncbi:hypothetical protein T09_429 [Trichinella sp. T9]|nr:hypothetical protein T09_429 [Trichinella sp. T9]